jgi:heme O synthase-like polyprenyltransferase
MVLVFGNCKVFLGEVTPWTGVILPVFPDAMLLSLLFFVIVFPHLWTIAWYIFHHYERASTNDTQVYYIDKDALY